MQSGQHSAEPISIGQLQFNSPSCQSVSQPGLVWRCCLCCRVLFGVWRGTFHWRVGRMRTHATTHRCNSFSFLVVDLYCLGRWVKCKALEICKCVWVSLSLSLSLSVCLLLSRFLRGTLRDTSLIFRWTNQTGLQVSCVIISGFWILPSLSDETQGWLFATICGDCLFKYKLYGRLQTTVIGWRVNSIHLASLDMSYAAAKLDSIDSYLPFPLILTHYRNS